MFTDRNRWPIRCHQEECFTIIDILRNGSIQLIFDSSNKHDESLLLLSSPEFHKNEIKDADEGDGSPYTKIKPQNG